MTALPTLLDVDEVAEALKVSPHTVRKWSTLGKLRRMKLGTRTLFDANEVARFVEDARRDSARLPRE